MNDPEKTPAPAAETSAPEAAPASAPEAVPAKDAPQPESAPTAQTPAADSTPPVPAQQPVQGGTDAKLDAILNAITTLAKALTQPAPKPAAVDVTPCKEDGGMNQLLAGITKAAQDSAAHAAQRSSRTTYETVCAESQAAYDAFNPHKHKEA